MQAGSELSGGLGDTLQKLTFFIIEGNSDLFEC